MPCRTCWPRFRCQCLTHTPVFLYLRVWSILTFWVRSRGSGRRTCRWCQYRSRRISARWGIPWWLFWGWVLRGRSLRIFYSSIITQNHQNITQFSRNRRFAVGTPRFSSWTCSRITCVRGWSIGFACRGISFWRYWRGSIFMGGLGQLLSLSYKGCGVCSTERHLFATIIVSNRHSLSEGHSKARFYCCCKTCRSWLPVRAEIQLFILYHWGRHKKVAIYRNIQSKK